MQFCEIVNFESKLLNSAVPTDPLTLSVAMLVEKIASRLLQERPTPFLGTKNMSQNNIRDLKNDGLVEAKCNSVKLCENFVF